MRNAMLTLKTTLKTVTSGTVGSILKPALFAVLMWTASAAGFRARRCRSRYRRSW